MTFIASVISRQGIAVIADSLGTVTKPMIDYDHIERLHEKSVLKRLVEDIPVFSRNYEDKLFRFDRYTAVSIAGAPIINDRNIGELIKQEAGYYEIHFSHVPVETKIEYFCECLNKEVLRHLRSHGEIKESILVFSHYNPEKGKPAIYALEVQAVKKGDAWSEEEEFVQFFENDPDEYVVCEGDCRVSQNIVYGDSGLVEDTAPMIIHKVLEDFNIPRESIPEGYMNNFLENMYTILPVNYLKDYRNAYLKDLSLQDAVNLAAFLLKTEISFQYYTDKAPTIGGAIKLAVIDNDGFRFISGHQILNPVNLS